MKITRIDIARSPGFAGRWAIQTIPTTLLLSGDREILGENHVEAADPYK